MFFCCCGPTCNFTETVLGCIGTGVTGATVTAKLSGVVVASGTTGADGTWCATLGAGTYTISVAPNNARFATPADHSVTLSGPGPWTDSTTLAAATGYVCCAACNSPLKMTLLLTDSNTTITVTWNVAGWSYGYSLGTQTVITSNSSFVCTTGPGDVALGYTVSCSGVGQLRVLNQWFGTGQIFCNGGATSYLVPSFPANNAFGINTSSVFRGPAPGSTQALQSSLTCFPLNFTGTLTTPTPQGNPIPSGMPSGTVTITETP